CYPVITLKSACIHPSITTIQSLRLIIQKICSSTTGSKLRSTSNCSLRGGLRQYFQPAIVFWATRFLLRREPKQSSLPSIAQKAPFISVKTAKYGKAATFGEHLHWATIHR